MNWSLIQIIPKINWLKLFVNQACWMNIFNADLAGFYLFHSICEHCGKNRVTGRDEGTMHTKLLFSDEELDVCHLPVGGGSPKLFAPSGIQKCVDEVINRSTVFDLKIKEEWTRRVGSCIINPCSLNQR